MYEIWLAMNIVWEIALDAWPWLLALGLLIVALWVFALRRGRACWRAGLGATLAIGAVVAVATALVLPMATRSSLAEIAYAPDWAVLLGLAAGAAALAMLLAWPLLSAPRPADAGRPPWGSSKVAEPHLLESALQQPRRRDAG